MTVEFLQKLQRTEGSKMAVLKVLREKNHQLRILYPILKKKSFKGEVKIQTFLDQKKPSNNALPIDLKS